MDFSFLEPVLRGESAAPPPIRIQNARSTSSENSPTSEDSASHFRSPSHLITIIKDDLTLSELSSSANNNYHPTISPVTSPSCLKVPSSIE
jgi:hypothetical protein